MDFFRKLHLPIFAVLLFCFSSMASALTSGGAERGTISSNEQRDTYSFTATAGDSVVLSAGGDLIVRTSVYAPDGSLLSGSTGAIALTSLPQNGTYEVVVRNQFPGTTGDYDLHFVQTNGNSEYGNIVSGSFQTHEITTGDLDSFNFIASAGNSVVISAAGELNIRTSIYAPDGTLISSSGTGQVLSPPALPQDGVYTVVTRAQTSGQTGSYNLHFVKAPGSSEYGLINSGVTLAHDIHLGDVDSFDFTANAGDSVLISAAGELAIRTSIYAPDGTLVVTSGSGQVLSPQPLPQGGQYTVVTHSQTLGQTGNYELHFVHVPEGSEYGLISSGSVHKHNITLGDLDSFNFTAEQGDDITISVDTGFFIRLSLYAPDGSLVARTGTVERLNANSLPQSGTYTIVAHSQFLGGTGDYTIALNVSGHSLLSRIFDAKEPWDGNTCGRAYVGNAINLGYGFKAQIEHDYQAGSIAFNRLYRNRSSWTNDNFGANWRHNYYRKLRIYLDESNNKKLEIIDGRGALVQFHNNAGVWQLSAPDYQAKFEEVRDNETSSLVGYVFTTEEDTLEYYNLQLKLTRIEYLGGQTLLFNYDARERLESIQDETGIQIELAYDELSRIQTLSTPDGEFTYSYDDNNNLDEVVQPDTTVRHYHYEDTRFLNALTGVTNEKNQRVSTYAYNDDGLAELTEYAGGANRYTLTYNDDGSTTVTNALNKQTTYHFETYQGRKRIVNVEGHPSENCAAANQSYSYNDDGHLTSITDWKGNITKYTPDDRGLVSTMTEAFGTDDQRTTTYTYHSEFRLVDVVTLDDLKMDYDYDDVGRLRSVTVTDLNTDKSRTTSYDYYPDNTDAHGYLIQGKLRQIDGPRTDVSDITSFEYDTNLRLFKIKNALGHETEVLSYDSSNRPKIIEDKNNVQTALVYDALGRLKTSTIANDTESAATTTYTYDDTGLLKNVTLANNVQITYGYDDAQRLTSITDSLNNSIIYTLDDAGNQEGIRIEDSEGVLQFLHTQVFDELSRIIESIDANNDVSKYKYDVNSNLERFTDAKLNATNYEFDALDRVKVETDAADGISSTNYTNLNQVKEFTNPREHATVFTYNAFGDVLTETSPDTGLTQYFYDSAGNLEKHIDARNIEAHYVYDALNRLTSISYPSDPTLNQTFTFDTGENCGYAIGRLCRVDHAGGATEYQYNILGQLNATTDLRGDLSFPVSYAFDAEGTLKGITLPSGRVVTYGVNANGQVESIDTTANSIETNIAQDIEYLPFGGVLSLNYGNNLSLINVYNTAYQLTDREIGSVMNNGYRYDAIGNITDINDKSYGYNDLYHLMSEITPSDSFGYQYDPIGGRLEKTLNSETTIYERSLGNQHLLGTTGFENNSYAYDANGNLESDGTTSFTYSSANRLQKIDKADLSASYLYDHANLRVRKTITISESSESVDYSLEIAEAQQQADQLQAVADSYFSSAQSYQDQIVEPPANSTQRRMNERYLRLVRYHSSRALEAQSQADDAYAEVQRLRDLENASPELTTEIIHYVYNIEGLLIGEYTNSGEAIREYIYLNDEPIAQIESDNKIIYLHTDHLSTPRYATSQSGSKVWEWESDVFGNGEASGSTIVNLRFPGQYLDVETNLHYNWNRYYNPETGQYITSDPIGLAGGKNTYAYALSNPVMYTDPTGEIVPFIIYGIRAAILIHSIYETHKLLSDPCLTGGQKAARLIQDVLFSRVGGPALASGGKYLNKALSRTFNRTARLRKGSVTKSVRHGPTNPGALADDIAKTFRGGSYTATTLSETTTLYRVYGGSAGKVGSYWTRVKPSGPLQSQLDSALAPQWGNSAQRIATMKVPKGTTIFEGAAAPQSTGVGQILGGGNQVYIPRVDPKWIQ